MRWEIPVLPASEREPRFAAIRTKMRDAGLDCLIVAGHQGNYGDRTGNFRYVANYAPWYDDEYIVFPLDGEPVLFAWSEPHAQWGRRVSWLTELVPAAQMSRGVGGKLAYPTSMADAVTRYGCAAGRIGICDFETMPTSVYLGLRQVLPDADIVEAATLLDELRMVKSPAEIAFVEEAARLADLGLAAMCATAKPGVTEAEVFAACERAMTAAGASPPSFTLLTSAPNLAAKGLGMPYAGSRRQLAHGDFLVNEISASYGGYWVQIDSPIVLSEVSAELRELADIHRAMYDRALELMRPGVTIEAVNRATAEIAVARGCDPAPAWSIAHIGLRIRDDIPKETVLQPNMTFALQPFTQHGNGTHGGHTIGTTVVVTDDGCRVLNRDPEIYVV